MKRLQELILDLAVLSVDQINQAIFSYPEFGLIESINRQYGESAELKILQHVSSALGIRILESSELEVDEELLLEKAIELAPLIEELKALPLKISRNAKGEASVMLAMANPLDSRAREAFRKVLQKPVETYLARERDIRLAATSVSGKLGLQARVDSETMSETALGSLTRYVEDPEVRKAVQQLTATAVKHAVRSIRLDLEKPYVDARFQFEDGRKSSVEISVNPVAMLRSLLRKGQVVKRSDDSLEGESRVSFKSSSVDIALHLQFQKEDEGLLVPSVLHLSHFRVDCPDNPAFWYGIDRSHAKKLREFFQAPSGLFILASKDARARMVALRALKQSFNDVYCVDATDELTENVDYIQAVAAGGRVLLAIDEENIFGVLSRFDKLSSEYRSLLRGALLFYAVPAVCPCCKAERELTADELESIPSWADLPSKTIQYGQGCVLCNERGVLGVLGVSSIFDVNSSAGKRFVEGTGSRDIALALVADAYESVAENGMRRIAEGKSSFTETLQTIPEISEELLYAAEEHRSRHVEVEEEIESEAIDLTLAPDEDFPEIGDQAPITGRGVFASGTRHKAISAELEDDFTLRAEEDSTESVVKESKPKLDAVAQQEPKSNGVPTLLVIDDDPDQRSILRKVFELEGYKVETAADGVDGIVSANRVMPTVIIVDFMMPELDGRETIQRLKGSPSTAEIPIVALTAYADPDVEYGLLKAGADDFCAKSVSKKVLLRRVERLVPEKST